MPIHADLYYHAYYPEDQDRLPIVLLHGAGGDHLHWPVHLRRLNGYRVFALDLPGHGKSNGHGLQSIPDYGARVLAWWDSLNLPRGLVIGHSMGGAIALWLGVHHPERLSGLGLVGTGARLPVSPELITETSQPAAFSQAVEKIIAWSFSPETDRKIVDLARERLEEVRPGVLHGDFLACDRYDLREEVGEIEVPAVVLCGEDDRMTPPRYSEALARRMPDARLEIISGAGHMVMIEQPERTAERISGFAAGLENQAG